MRRQSNIGKIDPEFLITVVRSHPILWQNCHEHHTHTYERWIEVASACNCSVSMAKRKWKHLKDTYRRNLYKLEYAAEDKVVNVKWRYFKMMSFVKISDTKNPCTHNNDNDDASKESDQKEAIIEAAENDSDCEFVGIDEKKKEEISTEHNQKMEMYEKSFDDMEFHQSHCDFVAIDEANKAELSIKHTENMEMKEESNDEMQFNELNSEIIAIDDEKIEETSIKHTEYKEMNEESKNKMQFHELDCEILAIDEAKKAETLIKHTENNEMNEEFNDDMQFFRSLLPFMTNFSRVQKLEVRVEMQNIILAKIKQIAK